jgi:hypothetical protein
MRPLLGLAALVSLAALCLHCAPTNGALLGPSGYDQTAYAYRVSFSDPGSRLFLPSDWQLDNWHQLTDGTWTQKDGPEYVATRELDENGDGRISNSERKDEFIYDLRFLNRRDDGVIWLKAHPLAPRDADRDLEVILQDYADGLSGTGLYAQSTLFNVEHAKARQFTTFVTSKGPVSLGSVQGFAGTIELAEVARLQLDPSSRSSKVKVAFFRINHYVRLDVTPAMGQREVDVNARSAELHCALVARPGQDGSWCAQKGLLVLGYHNTVAHFDQHLAEFDRLFAQVALNPDVVPAAPGPAPAPPPTPAPAPAPTPAPAQIPADGGT